MFDSGPIKANQQRYPKNNPIVIRSDRIAKNSDFLEKEKHGWWDGNTETQVLVLPKEQSIYFLSASRQSRGGGQQGNMPSSSEERRSYPMLGRYFFRSDFRSRFRYVGISDT